MRYAVVMAGGKGTRLWPLAREANPKQFQRLIFDEPLLAATVRRLQDMYAPEHILVVTGEEYADTVRRVLPHIPPSNILTEPFGRNTAAAIALAALRINLEDPEGVFAVFPADHVIQKPEALFAALAFANDLARSHAVIDIGVPPTHPETGYGYIQLGAPLQHSGDLTAYQVQRFVEKPDRPTAERYLQAGNFVWNSGMFVWRVASFVEALQRYLPATYQHLAPVVQSGDMDGLEAAYSAIPDVSVDYGIMEHITDVVAIPVDFGWRDVGDWAALYDMMRHDAEGNAVHGPHVMIDTEGSLVFAPGKVVAAVGVRDLIVVDTGDVLLVMPRDRAQDVKSVLAELRERGRADLL